MLARIREVAERESLALVVARDGSDKLYFDGAKLRCTLLKPHPRGFLLESDADLVPLPEPPSPPLFGEHDEPLMPHPEFEELVRRELTTGHWWDRRFRGVRPPEPPLCEAPDCLFGGQGSKDRAEGELQELANAIHWAERADRAASFPVRLVLPWQRSRQGATLHVTNDAGGYGTLWVTRRGIDRKLATRIHQALERPGSTLLWSLARRILGIGPEVEQIAALLTPYHEVVQPAALLRWKEAIERWNPWRTGGNGGLAESERLEDPPGRRGARARVPHRRHGHRMASQNKAEKCACARLPARLATPEEARHTPRRRSRRSPPRPWRFESWSPGLAAPARRGPAAGPPCDPARPRRSGEGAPT